MSDPGRPSPPQSARFRRTRADHQGETAEDYVEAIQHLIETDRQARVGALARYMGVSHVTVSRIIARLEKERLVIRSASRLLALTPAGARLAARIRRRHEDVLTFLLWLGVPAAQAHIDAEGIEHHVSDATIRAMRRCVSARAAEGRG